MAVDPCVALGYTGSRCVVMDSGCVCMWVRGGCLPDVDFAEYFTVVCSQLWQVQHAAQE